MAGGSRVMVGWGMPAIGRHGSEDHITPRCYNHPEGTHAGLAKNTAYSEIWRSGSCPGAQIMHMNNREHVPATSIFNILYLVSCIRRYLIHCSGAAGWKISTAFIKISVIALHMRSPYDPTTGIPHSRFFVKSIARLAGRT